MRFAIRGCCILAWGAALGLASAAHPCIQIRVIYSFLSADTFFDASGAEQHAHMALGCGGDPRTLDLTFSAGAAVSTSEDPTSVALGLDARGYQRLAATRRGDGEEGEELVVQLDRAQSDDLLERLVRARTLRVRFRPAGASREALVAFDLGDGAEGLNRLASFCSRRSWPFLEIAD